jgi:hypothetical protein
LLTVLLFINNLSATFPIDRFPTLYNANALSLRKEQVYCHQFISPLFWLSVILAQSAVVELILSTGQKM